MAGSLEQHVAGMFPDSRPIFVVGAARSGTTIVGDALRFGAGIPGAREGFVYSTAYLLLTQVDELWQRIGPRLERLVEDDGDDPDNQRAIARFDFRAYQAHCLRHFHELSSQGEEVWIDKTPDVYMVHASPILAAMYPRARWVWVQRNGIEVLDSRRRTHPEMTFAEACRDWASVVGDWHRVRAGLTGRWLGVEQREVGVAGAAVARRLADFLGLSDEQRAGIERTFGTHEPGRTTKRSFDEVLTLASAPWPDEQKAVFREVCADAMALAGYSM